MLRHAVMPLMEGVGRLYGGRVPAICIDTQEYFRDVHDHLYRIAATLDTIRDTISTAIQVNLSMVAIDESEVNKRLAAWAAIFAIVHRVRRPVGHEFQVHAGAGVEVRLPGGGGRDVQRVRLPVLALQALRLAVARARAPMKKRPGTCAPGRFHFSGYSLEV